MQVAASLGCGVLRVALPIAARVLLIVITAVATSASVAQEPAARTYGDVLTARCPGMVKTLILPFDKADTLKDKPLFVEGVCTCTKSRLEADPVVGPAIKLSRAELDSKLQSPEYSSVLQLHMLSAILGCTSLELEKTLAEVASE